MPDLVRLLSPRRPVSREISNCHSLTHDISVRYMATFTIFFRLEQLGAVFRFGALLFRLQSSG